jgi:hypothetical protein
MKIPTLAVTAFLIATSGNAVAKDFHAEAEGFLPCPAGCAKITIKDPVWPFPVIHHRSRNPPDIFIRVRVVQGVDGRVVDVNVLRLVGPKDIATQVRQGLNRWDVRAIDENGSALKSVTLIVQRYGPAHLTTIRDRLQDSGKEAQALLVAGKQDEAEKILLDAAATPDQSLNERLFLAGLLGSIKIGKGEFRAAADILDEPYDSLFSGMGTNQLPTSYVKRMASLRIQAALGVGDVVTALSTLEQLQKNGNLDSDGHIAAAVANVRADLDKADVIPVQAVIPASNVGDGFFFNIYRRHFDFHLLSGALKDYSLSCPQGVVDKPVDEAVRHDVPDDWGASCGLYVTGTPGTTFQVRDYRN